MKIQAIIGLTAVALLSGCSSVQSDKYGFKTSHIDPFIKVGTTTMQDVRALLGTPTTTGVTASDNSTVIGYALSGDGGAGQFGRNFGKGMLTFGLGSMTYEYTVKTLTFKFNADNVVTDYKKSGVSYLTKKRLTFWNECERKMTPEEVDNAGRYTGKEICRLYAEDVARKEGIPVDEVDTGKEFEFCNLPCQTRRALVNDYGEIKNFDNLVDEQEGDGSKSDLIFK